MAYAKGLETPRAQKRRRGLIRQNGWVLLFIAACTLVYFNAASRKDEVIASLDGHFSRLALEKASLLKENEDLHLQIYSQSDPAWIQLTLMKGLGLVPEGQLKVYFQSD